MINAIRLPAAVLLILVTCISFHSATFADSEDLIGITLPDIGDPASEILSVNQEIELGKILLAQVNRSLPVSTDPELRNYMQSLGTRLISGGLNSDFPYYFTLIFDPRINAFAMPGGIVAINSGLLLLSGSESELASVVAHEISHVSQRHLARRFSRQSKLSVVNAISLLGVIIAAATGSDAALGASTAVSGAIQASELAYSRDFEREADRLGMILLVNANLDPFGMPRFFEKLNAQSANRGRIPEILSTHPLTLSRISDSRSRAEQFKNRQFIENTVHFEYAKARALAISSDPGPLVKRYEELVEKNPTNVDHYIYGIGLNRLGRSDKSIEVLKRIKPNNNEEFTVSIALAQSYITGQQPDEAIKILTRLERLYPRSETINFYLASALLDKNKPKEALDRLDTIPVSFSGNPGLERLRAEAASRARLPWRSHEALSDLDLMNARYGRALEQLIIAKRQGGIDPHSKARIEAKIKKIQDFRAAQN